VKANLNYFQESSVFKKELIVRVRVTVGKDLSFLNGMIRLTLEIPKACVRSTAVQVRFPFL
jgi:hypothetical protein